MHDAACAREFFNGFVQSYTALEVLTDHLQPPTVLKAFYQEACSNDIELPYKTKSSFLIALKDFLIKGKISNDQAERIKNYVAMTQSKSQVDVFLDYLLSLQLEVTRSKISEWKKIRGEIVHSAEVNSKQKESMQSFRDIVRSALLEELRKIHIS